MVNGSKLRGISSSEAAARLASEGPNELPSAKRPSVFVTLFEVLKEPMLLLLLATAALYFVLGEARDAATAEVERAFVAALMERHGGNISAAARESGVNRTYLQKLLARHRRPAP